MYQSGNAKLIASHPAHWEGNTSGEVLGKTPQCEENEPNRDHGKSHPRSGVLPGYAYRSDPSLEKNLLSVRLMHRPSRSQNEFDKASDPTKENSLFNAFVEHDGKYDSLSPLETVPCQNAYGSPFDVASAETPGRFSLVRKKSGEIVKPLLKERGNSVSMRSHSLPTIPTYKQVHFGGDTDVRYFKKKDRPTAILALNSPTELDDDNENDEDIPSIGSQFEGDLAARPLLDPNRKSYFEYYDDELNSHVDKADKRDRKPAFYVRLLAVPSPFDDWKLALVNFSHLRNALESIHRGKSVFLENLFLLGDKLSLLGIIAVSNMAFEKAVFVRYSIDNWCTIVELQATYISDAPVALKTHNYDRFMFKISLDLFINGFYASVDPLSDIPSNMSAELCVRYLVKGQEFWDNNDGENYLFNVKREQKMKIHTDELPNSARTKQETHKKRPKYSSSYLKKIKSDLATSKLLDSISVDDSLQSSANSTNPTSADMDCADTGCASTKNNSSPWDDFESNNFYLSSPLFSSFANGDRGDDIRKETLQDPLGDLKLGRSSCLDHSSSVPKKNGVPAEKKRVSREFRPETDSRPFSPISDDLHEPMSYKDFLDSYCFFKSTAGDNASKTTLMLSDGPSTLSDTNANNGLTTNADPVYTVSSFLTRSISRFDELT